MSDDLGCGSFSQVRVPCPHLNLCQDWSKAATCVPPVLPVEAIPLLLGWLQREDRCCRKQLPAFIPCGLQDLLLLGMM